MENQIRLQSETKISQSLDFDLKNCDSAHFKANLPNKADPYSVDLEQIYIDNIDRATDSIMIENAYVTLNNGIHKALLRAANRINPATGKKIDIQIITNSLLSNDVPIIYASFYKKRKNLLTAGVKFYEFPYLQTLHSKVAVFDKRISIVGSFNLNRRASHFNVEDFVVLQDDEAALQILSYLEETRSDCVLVKEGYSDYSNISDKLKIKNFFNKIILLQILGQRL